MNTFKTLSVCLSAVALSLACNSAETSPPTTAASVSAAPSAAPAPSAAAAPSASAAALVEVKAPAAPAPSASAAPSAPAAAPTVTPNGAPVSVPLPAGVAPHKPETKKDDKKAATKPAASADKK